MLRRDLREQVEIAENQTGLAGDGKVEPLEISEDFEDTASDPELLLGRLIRIGCSTERNGQSLVLGGAKLGAQEFCCVDLGEDLPLKVRTVPHFHKFMGIAGVAVLAPKLATPVRVDSPDEGHAATGLAVERGARLESKELDLGPLANLRAVGCQARDANQSSALSGSVRGGLHRSL